MSTRVTGALVLFCLMGIHFSGLFAGQELQSLSGYAYRGATLTLSKAANSYKLGEKIEVRSKVSNVGAAPLHISVMREWGFYRLALYDAGGKPVPYTQKAESAIEPWKDSSGRGIISERGRTLQPGADCQETLITNDWFNIEREGTYILVATRRLDDGDYLISNALNIVIVK